jgi:hypothetical protein
VASTVWMLLATGVLACWIPGEKSSTGGPDGGTAIRVTRGKGEAFDIPAPPPDLLWAKRCKGVRAG